LLRKRDVMVQLGGVLQRACVMAVASSFALSAVCYAQRGRGGGAPSVPPDVAQAQQQEADFRELDSTLDADKKIKLIGTFLSNYPTSKHRLAVNTELVSLYYTKQDWTDFYATADKTIASYPDAVDVLVLVGWVIPHTYDADDADAMSKLDKAESYEKHAIEVILPMPKPVGVTDDQFAAAKTGKLSQAHSGLGLVYFRKQNWDDAVKELQEATGTVASPDQTDLYALAFGLQQLSRYSEAAEAYDKCGTTPGVLQARCKQAADKARSQIVQSK